MVEIAEQEQWDCVFEVDEIGSSGRNMSLLNTLFLIRKSSGLYIVHSFFCFCIIFSVALGSPISYTLSPVSSIIQVNPTVLSSVDVASVTGLVNFSSLQSSFPVQLLFCCFLKIHLTMDCIKRRQDSRVHVRAGTFVFQGIKQKSRGMWKETNVKVVKTLLEATCDTSKACSPVLF